MATSSAARCDVFIDFSTKDTRNSFVSHLSAAFRRRKISVFIGKDCTRTLEPNFRLPEVIQSAIDGSRVSVVVLSENYAFSPLCLETLVKFLERQRRKDDLVVIPVLYGQVTRMMVEQQTEKFGEAISDHGKLYSHDRVAKWRDSLIETASLPGHKSNDQLNDSELVERIVADVREKLDPAGTVGIYSRLLDIENLLCKQSHAIHRLGIWGMPGIGKTAIALAAYHQMSHEFVTSCLVEDFHIAFHDKGLYSLREKHITKVLQDRTDTKASRFVEGLRGKRVLVVLDDVRSAMGAESFLGGFDFIGPGSVIIIASRDKQVLHQCEVNDVYEVPSLNKKEALRLFSRSAFGEEEPSDGKLMELSNKVVEYTNGNPKALCFYGAELKNKGRDKMEETFQEIKQSPPKEIMDLFKSSCDALSDNERSIFLDIACFFNGEKVDQVMPILEGCGFFPHVGIDRLVEQSLLTISKNEKLKMHNLIQDIAQELVNRETKQIERRTRIWDRSSIKSLLEYNEFKATQVIEGIFLDTKNLTVDVNPIAFENMYNLRLLKIYSSSSETAQEVRLPKGLHSLPYELRLLHWERYPLPLLPQDFNPSHLVEINMPYSQLRNLGLVTKSLAKLKIISLSHSQQLVEADELSEACSIERIDLQGCSSLEHIPNTGRLKNLKFMNLSGCTRIKHTEIVETIKGLNQEGGLRETRPRSMVFDLHVSEAGT
ncbi:PREDICTED: disease resistance protein RRS1-like [Camelina sativa]|uniref:Disease resistance protein RRS1-like n=1 Tax=Camelina sativa TaxID=90675 RepID=A0ABM0Y2W8_CAMSA|nr:PREDICTED: disease resistance protein RRS1-like [Camelina sativa]